MPRGDVMRDLLRRKLLRPNDLDDPWGNPYEFDFTRLRETGWFTMLSYGPDGAQGTADDISPETAWGRERLAFGGGFMRGGVAAGMGMMGGNALSTPIQLARLRYGGTAPSTWTLPQNLAGVEELPAPSIRRVFQLGQDMGMGMMGGGMSFTINGRSFNENRIDVRAVLNNVEEWEFVNPTAMDHPMHIHTNPFQVLEQPGAPVPAWKDTVLVRAGTRLAIRIAFRDYAGMSMYHCHILDHEDLGMMGTLQIAAPAL
jgi:FtsP/CotA-like multicopper oxidase with cupredoxin domain